MLRAVANLEKQLDEWATSHGFKYRDEDRRDGTFNWFRKFETSIVPAEKASNPWTPIGVVKVGGKIEMTPDQEEKGRNLFGADFDELKKGLERANKELEKSGIAFKEVEEGVETKAEGEDEKAQDPIQALKLVLGRIKDKDEQAAGMLENALAALEKKEKPERKAEVEAKDGEKQGPEGEVEEPPKPEAAKEFIVVDEKVMADLRKAMDIDQIVDAVSAIAQSVKAQGESFAALQQTVAVLQESDEQKIAQKIQESARILTFPLPPDVAGQKEAAEAAKAPGQAGQHPLAGIPFGPDSGGGS